MPRQRGVDFAAGGGFRLSYATAEGGFNEWLADVRRREGAGVTVYGHPDTRTSRALWMAREVEAVSDLRIRLVPITSARSYSAGTDAINPNRRQPFVEDGGVAVFESMAVNLYLAKKYAAGILGPRDLAEEAAMLKWSFWAMSELDMKLWELVITGPARCDAAHPWYTHPLVRNPDTPDRSGQTGEERFARMFSHPRSAVRERTLVAEFQRSMRALELALAGRRFLAADRFTAADLNVCAVLAWSRHLGAQALAPYPRVQEWLTRCCFDRPLCPHYRVPLYRGAWVMYHAATGPQSKV